MCWPRFDSAPIFGALLDEDRGGRWRIMHYPHAHLRGRRARREAACSARSTRCDRFEHHADPDCHYVRTDNVVRRAHIEGETYPLLNSRARRIVIEHIVAPAALTEADTSKVFDELDAVDPLGHLVSELMFDS